uniref:Uncharacterized protein n=1 Tax=Trypanosoma congolense (strain IL3000) TaxID=1068625 RepID=G0UMR7_TRYCI|nr:hypothetical protein, unlikely [Trypanosoma congolense IL3000]
MRGCHDCGHRVYGESVLGRKGKAFFLRFTLAVGVRLYFLPVSHMDVFVVPIFTNCEKLVASAIVPLASLFSFWFVFLLQILQFLKGICRQEFTASVKIQRGRAPFAYPPSV